MYNCDNFQVVWEFKKILTLDTEYILRLSNDANELVNIF